ncbi:serine/threonine protein kinase, partial [Pyxidicoccus fallax]|nr:serine/threonine protein kinase [Pyxidicoccus fallax]
LGAGWLLSTHLAETPENVRASVSEEAKDGGTVAVGDSALTAPVPLAQAPSAWSTVAVEVPPKPLPGQWRPDANGRCPRLQVPINGGCWFKLSLEPKDCHQEEGYYVHQGRCYAPALSRARPPTSSPANRVDGAR